MEGKRMVILGAGESGVGSAVLANKLGYEVWVSDRGEIKEKYKQVLSGLGVRWEEGKHTEEAVMNADEVVKSPGIPDTVPLIKALREKGIPVISEIEFAGRHTDATTICITGSNGKTTTTLLVHHILRKAGLNVGLAGNVGQSFASQVAEEEFDYYVLELSSFQLDNMYEFRADIAVLLNITPDHLDRYDNDFSKYADAKFRIVQNQRGADVFIYNADDPVIAKRMEQWNGEQQCYSFSLEPKEGVNAWLEGNNLNINIKQQKLVMSIHDLALQGKHNAANSMAAGIAARVLDIRKEIIRDSLTDFQNIEHRLEFVARVHGIEFINDSKATNVNSTWYALESINKPIVWIAGGVDKGNDYANLEELVTSKVHTLVCMGEDNEKLKAFFDGKVENIAEARSAQQAVALAYRYAQKEQVVLMSPACASFDLFENYEDRGTQFKEAVKAL